MSARLPVVSQSQSRRRLGIVFLALLAMIMSMLGASAAAVPVAAAQTGSERETDTVRILTFTCPTGMEREGDDGLLAHDCVATPNTPYSVTIKDNTSWARSKSTAPGADGIHEAVFMDVPTGNIVITQSVPDGFDVPLVFCSDTSTGVGLLRWVAVRDGDSVTWTLREDADEQLTCAFFNFPAPPGVTPTPITYGVIELTGYSCPPNVDQAEDAAHLQELCRPEPIGFNVSNTGAYERTVLRTEETPIEFADVPSGQVYVTEWMPEGYGEPLVFCSTPTGSSASVPVDYSDTSATAQITFGLRAEAPVSCHFFHFPGGATS